MHSLPHLTLDKDIRQPRQSDSDAFAEGGPLLDLSGMRTISIDAVKRRFDPGDLFRMNPNIAPAAAPPLQASP